MESADRRDPSREVGPVQVFNFQPTGHALYLIQSTAILIYWLFTGKFFLVIIPVCTRYKTQALMPGNVSINCVLTVYCHTLYLIQNTAILIYW